MDTNLLYQHIRMKQNYLNDHPSNRFIRLDIQVLLSAVDHIEYLERKYAETNAKLNETLTLLRSISKDKTIIEDNFDMLVDRYFALKNNTQKSKEI